MKSYLYYGAIVTGILLMFLVASPAMGASGSMWTKSYYLNQGLGVMHEIQVDCGAKLDLASPLGGNYDLYALRNNDGPGTCGSNDYIMAHYDKISPAVLGKSTMFLEPGLWCVVVQARSGNGKYLLTVTRECTIPTPTRTPTRTPTPLPTMTPSPTPTPVITPTPQNPCSSPLITSQKTGLLSEGQTRVYAYKIGGPRTTAEWVLTGPCGSLVPLTLFTTTQASSFQRAFCGPDFDLYLYKDCDPRSRWCPALYSDTRSSSNAYISVQNPSSGSTYYALIHARDSGGAYTLTSRSYQCEDDGTIMI
jgi:hypothetical protein